MMSYDDENPVADNTRLNNYEIEKGCSKPESTPPLLNIDLIGICNMEPPCPMCVNWERPRGPRHHSGMELEDFSRFGKFFENASSLINCGIGEPLLHPKLLDILTLVSEEKKILGLNTNGLALDKGLADKLLPYSSSLTIIFSIDAASKETYSKLRADNFDEVIENITYYCRKRRSIRGDSREDNPLGAKTGLCFLPMKLNRHEVADFIRLATRIGVDVVELRSLNEVNRPVRVVRKGFLFDYQEQQLSDEALERVRLIAQEEAKKHNVHFDCQYSFDLSYTYEYFVPEEFKHLNIPCVLPWRFLLAYHNGDTIGCCYMNRSLGNWRRVGLDRLWNSRRMRKMRKELAAGKLADECLRYRSCPVVRARLGRRA